MFASKTPRLNRTCLVAAPDLFGFNRVACLDVAGYNSPRPAIGESRQ